MTYSIVARDPATGHLGVAVASRFFAVGAIVPHIRGGVGAVATQSFVNPLNGVDGLAMLAEGKTAADVVAVLAERDAGRDQRQFHLIDAAGRNAAYTGASCIDWAGHLVAGNVSVAGNMLAGPQVVSETVRVLRERPDLELPRRLITALKAGEKVGGDKRGKQSAALVIYGADEYSELDLRVDDHVEPLLELARLEAASRERWTLFRTFMATRRNPVGVIDRARIEVELEQAAQRAKAAE